MYLNCSVPRSMVVIGIIIVTISFHDSFTVVSASESISNQLSYKQSPFKLQNILQSVKKSSRQSFNYLSELIVSIPFTKILLASGALLSLFFVFIRLLIVLGPILILGAMTRESTNATDIIRMLIEFYNQVIVALDEQYVPTTAK